MSLKRQLKVNGLRQGIRLSSLASHSGQKEGRILGQGLNIRLHIGPSSVGTWVQMLQGLDGLQGLTGLDQLVGRGGCGGQDGGCGRHGGLGGRWRLLCLCCT